MLAPLAPPGEWFYADEADHPTPLTFTDEGRVYGHLAVWGSCHTGFLNGAFAECVQPPRSKTGYSHFHLGRIRSEEGKDVSIGKLTYDTDHAPLTAGLQAATRHYDHTGSVGAYVRARDGEYGIWLSGAVRSDLSPEGLRDLRANGPSGDWRLFNRNLELIASLAVPVQGFPIPQVQLALSAAGIEEGVSALILPAYSEEWSEEEPEMDRGDYLRRRHALAASVARAPQRSDYAIPERLSYRIDTREHALESLAAAAQVSDLDAQRVRKAVTQRYPDLA